MGHRNHRVGEQIVLPLPFWVILFASLPQTSSALASCQNSTDTAEQRAAISFVTAG